MTELLTLIIFLVVFLVPTAKILGRVGFHPAWCLVLLVPLLNVILLWVLAFIDWPKLAKARKTPAEPLPPA